MDTFATIVSPGAQPPRYMTQTEVRAFFRGIGTLRDRALFSLIYHYGLRVGEVGLLQRHDVDLARGVVLIRRLKGGAWSERPLFAATAEVLARWLSRLDVAPGALFPGRIGALRKRRIQALFTRYRDAAGLSRRYTCHSLRHSIATHLIDAGAPLEFVQDHLGHRSITSTTIYARISDRRRRALFRRLERSPWIVTPT